MEESPSTLPLVENGKFKKYSGTSSEQLVESSDPELAKSNFNGKRTHPRKPPDQSVGYRLSRRKELFALKQRSALVSLFFATVGVILMIIDLEIIILAIYENNAAIGKTPLAIAKFTSQQLYNIHNSPCNNVMKTCIMISTVLLLLSIVWYYICDVKLYMADNSLEDWTLAVSFARTVTFILEIFICSLCPIPGMSATVVWTAIDARNSTMNFKEVPVDTILAIPMVLRAYLVLRAMMLYSKLFTDARSQSLGALNRVDFNFKFIFKSWMSAYPELTLATIMLSILFAGAWAMRACEMYHDKLHSDFLNTLWVISITFLTVGYGDIVPNTYCGRAISVLTGIFGAFCTALIVAVLARRLEMSRMEKYVNNFVTDIDLEKQHKNAAANIVRAGWLIYKYKKRGNLKRSQQKNLIYWIHRLREIKAEQRRMLDNAITLVEMHLAQTSLVDVVEHIDFRHRSLEKTVVKLSEDMRNIDFKIDQLISQTRK